MLIKWYSIFSFYDLHFTENGFAFKSLSYHPISDIYISILELPFIISGRMIVCWASWVNLRWMLMSFLRLSHLWRWLDATLNSYSYFCHSHHFHSVIIAIDVIVMITFILFVLLLVFAIIIFISFLLLLILSSLLLLLLLLMRQLLFSYFRILFNLNNGIMIVNEIRCKLYNIESESIW